MDALIDRVAAFLEAHGLLPPDERVVVAASGGLDSMALLRVLSELAPSRRWTLTVAHYNHRLRGAESAADERFVRNAAKSLGLPCETARAGAGELRKVRGKSMEMACRDARHRFLAEVARKADAASVALAHHADDQLELFILRLIRGAGQGLAGMGWSDPSPADARLRLVRPFFDLTRTELAGFVGRAGIAFREDSSNASREPERNRARHEALPFLNETFARNVTGALRKSQRIVADDAACVEELARRWLKAGRRTRFENLHPAVQRQCLRLQLIGSGREAGFDLIEELRLRPETWISIARGEELSRSNEGALRERRSRGSSFSSRELIVELRGTTGEFEFAGTTIGWKRRASRAGAGAPRNAPDRETFDADKVGRKLLVRHWRPGDRFQPIGMPSPLKLQDWFVNQKIPRDRRRKLLVAVAENGDIFWVEGLRIGERFKVVAATRRRLTWTWQRDADPG